MHEGPLAEMRKACLGPMGKSGAKSSSTRKQVGLWKALNAKLMNLNLISQILESYLKFQQKSIMVNYVCVYPKHYHSVNHIHLSKCSNH